MKRSRTRALSLLLTIAMVLSLFVVPAGAVTLPEGKTWTLANGDWTNISSSGTPTHEWEGLKFDTTNGGQVKTPGSWTQFNEGAIVKVPVADCSSNEYHAVVTIKVYAKGTFTVAGKTNSVANGEESFKCVGTADTDGNHYVTITALAGGSDYLSTIAVSYVEGPLPQDPELTVDKDSVVVKENETVTITPTVTNVTDPEVTANSAESAVADATVGDDNVITITGTAAGKTKVTVGVTGTDCSAEVAVRVVSADPGVIDENNLPNITYKGTSGDAQADLVFGTQGVEWPINIGTDNGEGPHGANPVIKIHMPDGKQGDIVVSNCGYSSGNQVTMKASSGSVTFVNNNAAEGSNYGKTWTVAGAKGTTTLTFTGNNVYIHSLQVSNLTDAEVDPDVPTPGADEVEAGTVSFVQMGADSVTAVPPTAGLTIDGTYSIQQGSNQHGMNATSATLSLKLKLSAEAVVTVQGCRFGKLAATTTTATAAGTAVTFPETWDQGGDPEYLFEKVPAGEFVLTVPKGAWLHSVTVDYATSHDPQLQLSASSVMLKMDDTPTMDVTAMTRFTTAGVTATSANEEIVTAAVGEDGKTITLTAVKAGDTTVEVKLTGTEVTQTVTVKVQPAGEVVYDSWDFTASDWTTAEKVTIQGNTGTLRGLEIDATASGAKFSGNQLGTSWVQFNKDTIVKVPVKVPDGKKALVTVAAYAVDTITVDGVPNTEKTQQFVCAGTGGWVTIKGKGGQGYLASIKVEYGKGELTPILEINKDYLGLQLGKTESGEIEATVTNSTAAVKAVSADTSIATAAVDGKKVTLTAVGAGKTTVDISLEGATNDEAKKTVNVEVEAAGTVHYIAEGVYNFANYTADNIGTIKGLDTHGAIPQAASPSHGLQEPGAGAGTGGTATGILQLTVNIPEGRTADISFVTCRYGIGTALEMTATSGTVSKEETAVDSATGLKFSVAGASGETTFTFKVPEGKDPEGNDWNKGIWIHTMDVLFGAVMETNRQIDVWDLTGQVATGEGVRNNVAPEAWKGHAVNGALSGGTDFTVGDFSLIHNTNDRLYSSVENAESFGGQAPGYGKWEYEDGYVPNGGIYCNGTGGEGNRFMLVKNVFPGDKLVIYAGSAKDTVAYYVKGQGAAAEQSQEYPGVDVNTYAKMEFVAEYAGAYKIWGAPGKPMYQRVVRYPGVPVTGTVTLPADYNGPAAYGIKFVNTTTKAATLAEVNGNAFTVRLAPGYEYNAIMTGAPGWGFTLATKKLTTTETGGVGESAGMTHNMSVEVKETYTYSGAIAGFAEGYDLTDLAIDVLPEEGSGSDETSLTIDKTAKTFTAILDPEVEYTLVLKGADDYVIKAPLTVKSEKDDLTGQTLSVEPKATYTAGGKFVGLGADGKVTALSLVYLKADGKPDAKYTYPATVTADGYTAKLRDGAYEVKATVEGKYTTKTHVVVDGKDAVKDLLFVSGGEKPAVDKVKDVYVGYADKSPNFETVRDAMDAVSRMGITAEADRVTVHIAPGTYREQIMVTTPYVTFKNDEPAKGEVLLTWYYGIGYKYFSSGSPAEGGYYNPERAYDKFEKNIADRWGTAVRVTGKGFRAENITFENSFNRYITEEEILDGAEPAGNEAINLARNYNLDVTTKAATERAAAICVEADECEFYKCKFYSSQDTVYTQGKVYFKSCLIEGQTDYIFGDVASKCIFDGCQLSWKGYKNGNQGGYITALRSNKGDVGYLFRNCAVTANPKLTVTAGGFGRPWGADANVFFLNTKLEKTGLITDAGWTDMSGNKPENAQFGEFGTTLVDGTAVDTSKRVTGTVKTQADATAINDMTKYYGSWVPFYYVEEAATVAFEKDPYITDNGDINIPYPGHTLTANYSLGAANDANDASVIKWYRVAADGAETLLKTSIATVDKTYQIAKADIGAKIKVEVTPTTLGGKTGAAKSATLVETVKDGYDDPSGVTDPDLGTGVNIFLAGDSTVKDYGASGMYQGGKPSNEGSWGEFLQNYFNSDLVTVVNYANGGRSTRNFLNEGSLDKIAQNIKEGDYLFIQFGHNDCANDKAYREDRYVPLGTPDANGVYPSTPGTKGADGKYTWDCGGTYKWFLQQYIDVAKKAGATPVLVTPVARMYYGADGSINPHHDASLVPGTETTTETKNDKKSNTYCEAVRQLAKEQNVLLIDGYALTEQMFVDAYKAGGNSTYGQQTMTSGDSTHSNKLGGMIEAGLIAQTVQNMGLNISKTVKAPAKTMGESPKGETVFVVDGAGKFTAYDMLSKPDAYTAEATYWMGMGQKLFDAIAAKAETFQPGGPDQPDQPADKAELNTALADAAKATSGISVVADGTDPSAVASGKKFVTRSDKDALDAAIAAAKAVAADENATADQIAKAVTDLKAAVKTFTDAIQTGTKTGGSSGRPSSRPSGDQNTGSISNGVVNNPDGSVATIKTDAKGDKTITVKDENGETMAEIKLPATIPTSSTKFVDVPDGHWAAKAINDMAGLDLVKGVKEDTYDMVSPITRGAIATIFFRLSNGAEGKSVSFNDVAKDAWYADAVGWAAGAKLINGYNEAAFGPEDTITRQQLAVMIARFMRMAGVDTTAEATALGAFADHSSTDLWAVDGMAWCVSNGVIKGKDGNRLDPTAAVTRAEAATMLDRAIGLLK